MPPEIIGDHSVHSEEPNVHSFEVPEPPVNIRIILVHHHPEMDHADQREDTAEEDVRIKDHD
jgi:hypothetical protein